MSIALDFSDMFRQAPERPANATASFAATHDAENNVENICPASDSTDLHSWVKNTLKSMNFSVKDEDLTANSLQIWQRVLFERLHWQNQSQSVVEENISLRRKYEILDREKNALKNQLEGMQQVNKSPICC